MGSWQVTPIATYYRLQWYIESLTQNKLPVANWARGLNRTPHEPAEPLEVSYWGYGINWTPESPVGKHSPLFEVPACSVHFLGKLQSHSKYPQHGLENKKSNKIYKIPHLTLSLHYQMFYHLWFTSHMQIGLHHESNLFKANGKGSMKVMYISEYKIKAPGVSKSLNVEFILTEFRMFIMHIFTWNPQYHPIILKPSCQKGASTYLHSQRYLV